jgi:hypothetical protein
LHPKELSTPIPEKGESGMEKKKMYYGVSRVKDEDMGQFMLNLKITDDVDCLSCEMIEGTFGTIFVANPEELRLYRQKILMDFLLNVMVHSVEMDTIDGYEYYSVDAKGGLLLCK